MSCTAPPRLAYASEDSLPGSDQLAPQNSSFVTKKRKVTLRLLAAADQLSRVTPKKKEEKKKGPALLAPQTS